jgi:DNA polymerase-3 subunit gamma/tau
LKTRILGGGFHSTRQQIVRMDRTRPLSEAAHRWSEGHVRRALKRMVHRAVERGRLEFRPDEHAPRTLANRLGALLSEWTGRRWVVAVSGEPGEPTLTEQEAATDRRERAEATAHPLVQAALAAFPGATIEAIRDLATVAEPTTDGEPEA